MIEFKRVLRSPREIRKMRKAGLVVWEAHQTAARILKPGITTDELDEAFVATFRRHSAVPLFLGYGLEEAPFPAVTCISVNEEVVHGIPGSRIIQEGDTVSLDTGCKIDGWCGDAAVTHAVGQISAPAKKLLEVTLATLNLAIDAMEAGRMWSSIAKEMENFVDGHGLATIVELTGHGIGRKLHEPPQVPNYWSDEISPQEDFDIRPGAVIAIEPMINIGQKEVEVLDDQWTTVTADGSLSAHFEHTVAFTNDGPIRLTGPPNDEELEAMPEWLHDKSQWVLW